MSAEVIAKVGVRCEPPVWPAKQELMGVRVSVTSYDEVMRVNVRGTELLL